LSSKICPDNFVTQKISRHYLTVNGRLVHYRRCGSGPPLIMVHQSPRSSAEYEGLMRQWGADFTCIAPDTPGFGQSHPLAKPDPDINDYADALAEFIRALGIERTAAYGFHSGGIILVTALKRHPELFTGLAVGGYAIWTPQEMAIFGDHYLPPFVPSDYGEHLTWLWNRILEQSWFFPWFDVRGEARLSGAHDDPARVHAIVMEMLEAGDAYRLGYGAVLRAPRDIPPADAQTCPVLISAYDGDPLQAHIDRLGAMPRGWSAQKVATPEAHQDLSIAFLRQQAGPSVARFAEDADRGFIDVQSAHFGGLIHWRGKGSVLSVARPGESIDLIACDSLSIDPPGHGLSDGWQGDAPTVWPDWDAVFEASRTALGAESTKCEPVETGEPALLFPDLSPDRHGAHLTAAWGIVRARHFFSPWYKASAAHARSFDPASIRPVRLAIEHRALLRATAARAFQTALSQPK
jgi:pimeloyl-ACP methyl ester carboxylesterase